MWSIVKGKENLEKQYEKQMFQCRKIEKGRLLFQIIYSFIRICSIWESQWNLDTVITNFPLVFHLNVGLHDLGAMLYLRSKVYGFKPRWSQCIFKWHERVLKKSPTLLYPSHVLVFTLMAFEATDLEPVTLLSGKNKV